MNFQKTYCVVCKKDTENKNPKVFKTINGRLILRSTCSVCENKKSRLISKNGGSDCMFLSCHVRVSE